MSKPGLKVDIVGVSALKRKLVAVDPIVRNQAAALVRTTTWAGQSRARSIVPVRTGALQRAISAIKHSDVTYELAVVGPPTAYAVHVEYGTRRGFISGRFYMRSSKGLMRELMRKGARQLKQTVPGDVARA